MLLAAAQPFTIIAITSQPTNEGRLVLKDFLPLIGSVVGAVIALGGALTVQRIIRGAERRKVRREKLEEALLIALGVLEWADAEVTDLSRVFLGSGPADAITRESGADKVVMLARLYDADVVPPAEGLREATKELAGAVQSVILEAAQGGSLGSLKERFQQSISAVREKVRVEQLKTIRSIERAFEKYV